MIMTDTAIYDEKVFLIIKNILTPSRALKPP